MCVYASHVSVACAQQTNRPTRAVRSCDVGPVSFASCRDLRPVPGTHEVTQGRSIRLGSCIRRVGTHAFSEYAPNVHLARCDNLVRVSGIMPAPLSRCRCGRCSTVCKHKATREGPANLYVSCLGPRRKFYDFHIPSWAARLPHACGECGPSGIYL